MFRLWRSDRGKDPEGLTLGGVPLGKRPWLVLGGGGLKGLAHLGALRALRTRGFEPAGILGTSIGALVGACVAGGRDLDELFDVASGLSRTDIARVQRRAVWVRGFRAEALFRAEPLREYMAGILPREGWEGLEVRFQANAVELGSARTEWFGIGARTDVSLLDAVYASTALPVFYPPIRLPGGIYVDGGVEYTLPLHRAAELGATGIVAIDPGSAEHAEPEAVVAAGMLGVHQRVFAIMSGRVRRATLEEWSGPPVLYVRPDMKGYAPFDFDHISFFLEEGERAAEEALQGRAISRTTESMASLT
jgi:NTE family protein